MRTTRPLSVTLPTDMADMVKAKVASGEYATESEVVRDGLRTLRARDAAMERWLREEVGKAYDDIKRHPDSGIPAEKILDRFRERHKARGAK